MEKCCSDKKNVPQNCCRDEFCLLRPDPEAYLTGLVISKRLIFFLTSFMKIKKRLWFLHVDIDYALRILGESFKLVNKVKDAVISVK